jgi:Uma2 family endonuclease
MSINAPVAEVVAVSPDQAAYDYEPIEIDYEAIITENDTPVDNLFSEREQRLLAESLYTSWPGPGDERPFLAITNVGLFFALAAPPYVPDVLVSLDVRPPDNPFPKKNRSYFMWEYGKPPEIVVEVVSNRKGGELDEKLAGYARLGVTYYIVHDPEMLLTKQTLYVFVRQEVRFVPIPPAALPGIGLGVTLWEGKYEDTPGVWLRWTDAAGNLLLTGKERAEQERQRAEQERQRADALAAKLRALGIDPDL